MTERLRLEVLLAAVDKVTGPLDRIRNGSKKTAEAVGETKRALKELESQQRKIQRLKDAMPAMGSERNAMRVEQAKLAALRASGSATATQIAKQEAALKRQTAAYEKQRATVLRLRSEVNAMGVGGLAAAQAKATASTQQLNAELEEQNRLLTAQRRLERQMQAMSDNHGKAMHRAAMVGGLAAGGVYAGRRMVQASLSPVGSFMEHENAMLGVQRQVAGARGADGNPTEVYRQVEAQIRALSGRMPQTTTQIADMVTAAARMEVPTGELAAFVELASEMGTAFDTDADSIAESMGKIAKNLKIPVTEIRGMADAINYLDDNAISKGADIIGLMNRISGITGTVGISGRDMAALGSTLLTSGESEETAGTGIKAIFTNLAAATRMPASFQGAIKEAGLEAKVLQDGMAQDAVGTLLKVAEAIRKLPQSEQLGVMADIAGKEHVGRLAKLVNNTEELRRQIALANGEEARGSMAREAAVRNQALEARLQQSKNRLFNASAVAGEQLKGAIVELLEVVNPLLERFTEWAQKNPAIVGGFLKAAIAVGVLLTAVSALTLGAATLLGPMLALRFGLKMWQMTALAARAATVSMAPAMGLLYRAGFMLGRAFAFLRMGAGLLLTGLRVLEAFLIANPIVIAIVLLAAAA